MVLAVCGGSPGEKDELDPGNGSTGGAGASAGAGAAADNATASSDAAPAVARDESGSAQENTHAAAEAALQVRPCMCVERGRAGQFFDAHLSNCAGVACSTTTYTCRWGVFRPCLHVF